MSGSKNARSYPLSYVYSGGYYWSTGRLYNQSVLGRYWSSSVASGTNNYNFGTGNTRLIKANTSNKLYGFALRCSKSNILDCDATQSDPVALITGVGLNQAQVIHSQVVTTGTIINSR